MDNENQNKDASLGEGIKETNFSRIAFGLSLSGWVAGPVIIGFFVGRYLVENLHFPKYYLYTAVVVSIGLSFYGLTKQFMTYVKKIESEEQDAKSKKSANIEHIANRE